MSSYTITIPDVPPSLNALPRHWAAKRDLREYWRQSIFAANNNVKHQLYTRSKVTVTLHNSRQYDRDNAYGACKIIFDALKHLGWIVDDRAEFLEASVEQVKCSRKEKKTVIEIGEAL